MRVGIVGLLHESNTFVAGSTNLDHFRSNLLVTGQDVRRQMADAHHELGGFFAGLADEEIEAVPIFAARAVPFGTIAAEAFRSLLRTMFAEIDRAGDLDGILVACHGATVSESHPDADGFWLSELRQKVGAGRPIIGTLDLHANLSPQMVTATDALIAYRSNPHLDQRARGIEAARLMGRTLRGELRPVQAACFPPLAINIERQLTSEPPLQTIGREFDQLRREPKAISHSLLLGFPYADVSEMGAAVVAVADGDPAAAANQAKQLGRLLWDRRHELVGQLVSVEEALRVAASSPGPICLLDMGDNVGGGSPGDGTYLLEAVRRHRLGPGLGVLYDPAAVETARDVGQGNTCQLEVGGKTDTQHGAPLRDRFRVVGLYDGTFSESQPRHGGLMQCDQGPGAAVIETAAGLTVLLTSLRMPPFSLQQLLSCQLDPRAFQVIIAKGVNAPVAAYQEVCEKLIRVNTPGCTTADMTSLEFRQRRRPLFPFEDDAGWQPTAFVPDRAQ